MTISILITEASVVGTGVSPTLLKTVTDGISGSDSVVGTINASSITITNATIIATGLSGPPPTPSAQIFITEAAIAAEAAVAVPSPTLFVTITDVVGADDDQAQQTLDTGIEVIDGVRITDSLQPQMVPYYRQRWFGGEWVTPVRRVWVAGNWHPTNGR